MAEWQWSTGNADVFGKIVWSESGASSATNKSTVKATVYYYRDDNEYMTYGTCTGTLTVAGSSASLSKYVELKASNGWGGIGSKEVSVTHDADGSKSIEISWSGGFGSGVSVGNQTSKRTVTLAKIARASTPTTDPTALTIGTAFTIKTNRASSSFTHKIHLWWGYKDKKNYTEKWLTNVGDSVSVTLTEEEGWASYLPNASSGVLGISCETFSGSTSLGTKQIMRTMSVPSSWTPTAGTVTATASKPFGTVDYLQDHSTVTLAMSGAEATHGATIGHYVFSNGSDVNATSSGNSYTTGAIAGNGDQTYTVTVYDSRGLKASSTVTISVSPYAGPSVTLNAYRANADGTQSDVGEYIIASVSGTYTALDGANTFALTIDYQTPGSGSWTTARKWTGQTAASYTLATDPFEASSTKTWTVRATITDDAGGSATATFTVGIGIATVDFLAGGKSVTFFGTATKEGLWNNLTYNNLKFFAGTLVVNPGGGDATSILTMADINNALGVTNAGPENTFMGVSNGDGALNSVHVEGATYLNGKWWATLSAKTSRNIRINFFVVYWAGGGATSV